MGDDQLGDAGRRAIESERQARRDADTRAQALETELQTLRAASQTDAEKALEQAKRDAKAEERGIWQAHIRSAEVRSTLRAAGLTNDKTLALAAQAPEFSGLKVTEAGAVEKLAETVEQFKKDYPELFAQAGPTPPTAPTPASASSGGSWDGAAGGRTAAQPSSLQDAVSQQLAKQNR